MSGIRAFAEDTVVPVHKSRDEIQSLLLAWGCLGIQWEDDFQRGTVTLRFRWKWKEIEYIARMRGQIPTHEQVQKELQAQRRVSGHVSPAVVQKAHDQRLRSVHRLIALKLRADLNCVRAGMFSAMEVLLPYCEGVDGQTIGELAAGGGAQRLLALTDRSGGTP